MTDHLAPSNSTSHSDTLLLALFVAAILHAILLLGLNFSLPQQEKVRKSIEVTLSSTPAKKTPKKARFLAQDNQIGGGAKTQKPQPKQQKIPSHGQKSHKKRPQPEKKHKTASKSAQKLITSRQKSRQTAAKVDKNSPSTQASKPKPRLNTQALQQQIAQMGEKIRTSQPTAEYNRMKFINQLSTHKYVAAQYMKDWENKVERTGNLNYPEIARQKGFSGTLTMDVGIRADGTIYSMRITRSSGIKALDDAAKRIVRLSAPFAELPAEILQEVDVLVIRRVWKFSDESGMTAR